MNTIALIKDLLAEYLDTGSMEGFACVKAMYVVNGLLGQEDADRLEAKTKLLLTLEKLEAHAGSRL
jgi:hypothetical protein